VSLSQEVSDRLVESGVLMASATLARLSRSPPAYSDLHCVVAPHRSVSKSSRRPLRGICVLDQSARECTSSETDWRSEIDSNSRSRWLSGERADFGDFPFSAWETDRDQLRSAVPEKDRLPAAKRAMCVSAQRSSRQAPVLEVV
jgi:hypothetical protein